MNVVPILFYFFIGLAASAAAAMLFSKSVFKSALYLLVCLLSIAALYVLAFAEFLAVTQILVYAGGIMVVIIFGIMLTTKISGAALVVKNTHIAGGIIVGIGFCVLLMLYLPDLPQPKNAGLGPENIEVIALAIFSAYSLPFEIAGILLLIAVIGAAVITSYLKSDAK